MYRGLTAFLFSLMLSCGVDWNRENECLTGCPGEQSNKERTELIYIPGPPGPAGQDGANGRDGYSTVYLVGPALDCPSGGSMVLLALDTNRNGVLDLTEDADLRSFVICNGVAGRDGIDGTNGSDGKDGVAGKDGVNGKDGVDGINGIDGKDGTSAAPADATPVAIVDPCGDAPGILDEVLLILANGTVLASVSDSADGKNTRLAVVPPGNYMTTDGSACYFTVDSSGQITDEHY